MFAVLVTFIWLAFVRWLSNCLRFADWFILELWQFIFLCFKLVVLIPAVSFISWVLHIYYSSYSSSFRIIRMVKTCYELYRSFVFMLVPLILYLSFSMPNPQIHLRLRAKFKSDLWKKLCSSGLIQSSSWALKSSEIEPLFRSLSRAGGLRLFTVIFWGCSENV
jgi:hypothetical protein